MYELVIVQDVYEVDPLRLDYLSTFGHRFSIVRPDAAELTNGAPDANYCAIARNEATRLAQEEWVVFLLERAQPDRQWFADLEADLVTAAQHGAAASVSGDLDVAATRAADIAYRRDVLDDLGGFDETFEESGLEDFEFGLRLIASGSRIMQGSRSCTRPKLV